MSGCLLDVNVLIALMWPTHVHHAAARRWFDRNASAGWAATWLITQFGFVRVSSSPKIIRDAVPPREAVAMLVRLSALPGHHFWPDEITVSESGPFAALSFIGHRQVTDAYLLALVQRQQGRLVTFDHGIAELIPDHGQRERRVELIDPGE